MHIEGLDRTEQDEIDSNRYMAWLGGQVTLQSQSRTGGFQKPRDVVSTSYYDRVMSQRLQTAKELRDRSDDRKISTENKPISEDERMPNEPNNVQENGEVVN
uniref:Uncharacterized protein n=1 Tax=Ascaris lumbricoides TaxID=6252 RepID=A0A0M3IT00_ASCLU